MNEWMNDLWSAMFQSTTVNWRSLIAEALRIQFRSPFWREWQDDRRLDLKLKSSDYKAGVLTSRPPSLDTDYYSRTTVTFDLHHYLQGQMPCLFLLIIQIATFQHRCHLHSCGGSINIRNYLSLCIASPEIWINIPIGHSFTESRTAFKLRFFYL